jgi:hypothetical protein
MGSQLYFGLALIMFALVLCYKFRKESRGN